MLRWEIRLVGGTYPAFYSFSMLKPVERAATVFEDENLAIEFKMARNGIGFKLANRSSNIVRLNWNETTVLTFNGQAESSTHDGVKYTDAKSVKLPSVLPPGATLGDTVIPASHVYYREGEGGGWRLLPMFPDGPDAKALKGAVFGLYLALDLDGKSIGKTFSFKIEDVSF